MEIAWRDVWELFRLSILTLLTAGVVVPVVGCFLLVRRTGFHGVVLPQLAACGVAAGFATAPIWLGLAGGGGLAALQHAHDFTSYHLAWAGLFTFGGLLVLAALRGTGSLEPALLAATFALAASATVLFAHASPAGEYFVGDLLRGEILAISPADCGLFLASSGLVLAGLLAFRERLVVASYDPDLARLRGEPVRRLELLSMVLIGITVSVGALIVGPVPLFGLLVLPPLAAQRLATSMARFFLLASGTGLLAAVGGLVLSFGADLPLGPCVVVVATGLTAGAALAGWIVGR